MSTVKERAAWGEARRTRKESEGVCSVDRVLNSFLAWISS
jgi:hypothetical protein